MRQVIVFNNKNVILPEPWVQPGPANDEIWYTSSDGNVVTPWNTSELPTIVSNTYVDGKGIIKFASVVATIVYRAFYRRYSLTSVSIGNSVTSIGDEAFRDCTRLTSIIITNSVTSIGNNAFSNCTGLTSVTIGIGVAHIADGAFYYCTGLTTISYAGTIAQYNAITKSTSWHVNVPATVVHCTDGDAPI